MRMVLFGAGASYGSGPTFPAPPPLGKDLFAALKAAYPHSWGVLTGADQARFTSSFENGMGTLLHTGSHAVPPLMKDMARFFARYMLQVGNAYLNLLDALSSAGKLDDLAFATLNYECLLEWALGTFGRESDYFGNPTGTHPSSPVLKLHGSCNFMPGTGLYVAPSGISYSGLVTLNPPHIQPVDPSTVAAALANTGMYPVMAFYEPGKTVQIAPDIVKGVQQAYASRVSSATTVAVIGVSPNVNDAHVWEPLRLAQARILFVGDHNSYKAWKANERRWRPSIFLGDRFDATIGKVVQAL